MRLDGQLFAEITQFSKYAIFQANDGVVGLDFRHKEMGQARTLLDVMYTRGLIREPSFAFQMTRKNGVIIFGRSVRDTYIAPLNYVHLSNNNHWQIRVDHIQVVGHPDEYCIQGCETLVDPSNNKIAGPYRSMKRLNTQVIGAQISRIDGRYYVPCALVSTLPDIVITINNVKYVLTPSVYIVPVCFSVFSTIYVFVVLIIMKYNFSIFLARKSSAETVQVCERFHGIAKRYSCRHSIGIGFAIFP